MSIAPLLKGAAPLFFVGTAKNAGKTSAMNACLRLYRLRRAQPGIISSGVDGEALDAISGAVKPAVPVERGDLICTSAGAVSRCACALEVLAVLPFGGARERACVARVTQPGTALLVGPRTNAQLAACVAQLRQQGARKIFVDGAFDRSTQIGRHSSVDVLLVVSPGPHEDPASLARRVEPLALRYMLPRKRIELAAAPGELVLQGRQRQRVSVLDFGCLSATARKELLRQARLVHVGGALTDSLFGLLDVEPWPLILVSDPARIFLSAWRLLAASRSGRLRVSARVRLRAVVLGPSSGVASPRAHQAALAKQLAVPVHNLLLLSGDADLAATQGVA